MSRQSETKGLALASVIMMASILMSRGLGVLREVVLAKLLGTSNEMDAYVAAFLLPELVNHILAGGFISVTFIPIFQRHIQEGRSDRAWKSFSNLFTVGSAILIALIVLSSSFTPNILSFMGRSVTRTPEQLALTVHLTRIILPAQLFIYWGALLVAVQMAHKKFLLPAMAPLFYNAGIIAGGVLLYRHHGVAGFSWGVTMGAFAGNVLVQIPGALRVRMRYTPSFNLRDSDFVRYVVKTLPLIVGVGMTFSNEVFFRIFGSFLDKGSLATINYSLRAMLVLVGVFGQALGVSSFPYLSSLVVAGKLDAMNHLAHRVLTRTVGLLIPFSAIMIALSGELVDVLYRMGKFDSAAAAATVPVLQLCLLGAFTGASTTILMRCFYARQNTLLPMVLSTITAGGAIPLYLILGKTMGAPGIALAGSLFMIVQCVLLYVFWYRAVPSPAEATRLAINIIKTVVAAAAGFVLCAALEHWASSLPALALLHHKLRALAVGCIAGIPALAVSFFIVDILGVLSITQILKRPQKLPLEV